MARKLLNRIMANELEDEPIMAYVEACLSDCGE